LRGVGRDGLAEGAATGVGVDLVELLVLGQRLLGELPEDRTLQSQVPGAVGEGLPAAAPSPTQPAQSSISRCAASSPRSRRARWSTATSSLATPSAMTRPCWPRTTTSLTSRRRPLCSTSTSSHLGTEAAD